MTFLLVQLAMATIILVGMIGFFYPEKIQSVELRLCELLTFGIPNLWVSFVATEDYLRTVRAFGAVSFLMAVGAEYVLFLR